MAPNPYDPPPIDRDAFAGGDMPAATDEERTWALFMHLSHLVALFIGIPVVTPLILWAVKKDQSEFLDDQGKEAINFEISLLIWFVVTGVGGAIIGVLTCGVGFVLLAVPWILGVVGTIMGTVASTKGRYFRYPMCWRFIH